MAVTLTDALALPLVDDDEPDWGQYWRDQNNKLNTRLAGRCTGNPNGQVQGYYQGQQVWSIDQEAMYACKTPGTNATTVWVPISAQGVVPISRGGTGQTTVANARAALEVHPFYGDNTIGYRPGIADPQPDTRINIARSDGYGQAPDSWNHMPIQVQNHGGGHAGYAFHNPGVNAAALVYRRDSGNPEWWCTDKVMGAAIFKGMIFPFYGTVAQIPLGYALCDGNNGTPDLRNRTIVGTGNGGGYAVGQTFGSDSATTSTVGAHNHSGGTGLGGAHAHDGITQGTALNIGHMPAHTHSYSEVGTLVSNGAFTSTEGGAKIGLTGAGQTGSQGSGAPHAHGFVTNPTVEHTHGIPADGGHSHSVDVRQASCALLFIMKL